MSSTVQSPQETEDDEVFESQSCECDVDMVTFSCNPNSAQDQRANGISQLQPEFESQQQLLSEIGGHGHSCPRTSVSAPARGNGHQQFLTTPLSIDSVTDVIFLVDGSDSFNKINKGKNFLVKIVYLELLLVLLLKL